jgi:hypothetical protein
MANIAALAPKFWARNNCLDVGYVVYILHAKLLVLSNPNPSSIMEFLHLVLS